MNNSYNSFYQLVKTNKDISQINDIVSDRLIITKQGKLYFDYSDTERIELTSGSQYYKTNITYNSLNETVEISYNNLFTINDVSFNELIITPKTNVAVFDANGNIAIITEIDNVNKMCKALVCSLFTNTDTTYTLSREDKNIILTDNNGKVSKVTLDDFYSGEEVDKIIDEKTQDVILQYATKNDFPDESEAKANCLYIARDTNIAYRWSNRCKVYYGIGSANDFTQVTVISGGSSLNI